MISYRGTGIPAPIQLIETRNNLGRAASRSRLWDYYWGRVVKLAAILSPVAGSPTSDF